MKHKIGIIGEGQLALMLAESLSRINQSFLCFSLSDESPMQTYFPTSVTRDLAGFRKSCNVFTLENEFHSIPELNEMLQDKTEKLFPDINSYSFFADKISQRNFYVSLGINSPKWMPLRTQDDLSRLKAEFSFPFILKTSRGGYDGKGVRVITDEAKLQAALKDFNFAAGNELLIEEKVQMKSEVAQGFLRNQEGQFTILPLVETVQEDGICNLVQYPSQVSINVKNQIEFFITKLINSKLVGIFNFEFFVDVNDHVMINEGAPRTHNSQHLTMDASSLSQFDLLALYLTNPKGVPEKIDAKASVMINILGKKNGAYGELKLPDVYASKISPKLYGKKKSGIGRKMGHVNIVDEEGHLDLLSIGRKILKEYDL